MILMVLFFIWSADVCTYAPYFANAAASDCGNPTAHAGIMRVSRTPDKQNGEDGQDVICPVQACDH